MLAEAGYTNGFEAGEFTPYPPYNSIGEAIANYLHQIQRLLAERGVFAPIWKNGFIRAFGPRAEEPGLTLIPAVPYSGPLEDVRLKK